MRVTPWIWAGPVAFVVHDAEELATIAPWLAAHRTMLPSVAQPLAGVTPSGFAISIGVLLLGFLLAAARGAQQARRGRRSVLWLVVWGAFVANGATHVAQAAWFGSYVPGLVTAVVVSLPYGIGMARVYRRAGLASTRELLAAAGFGLLIQGPLVLAALSAGGVVR